MSTTNEEDRRLKEEATQEDEEVTPAGCGILGRYPVLSVLAFAAVGIGMGVGLSYWSPDDDDDSKEKVLKWIGLLGDLFIRALKCVVLPLVFSSSLDG